MAKKKSRTLFYRRVAWLNGEKDSFQKHLSSAHRDLLTTKDRVFPHGAGEMQGLYFESTKAGLFFHLAEYVPHQPTSLVPFPSDAESKNTSPEPPPDKHDYLVGDIFFLVRGNDIVFCPSGARENSAISYMHHTLRKSGKERLITQFNIEPVASVDKVNLIKKEGVKKVTLNSTLYAASVEYAERKTIKTSLLNRVAAEFIELFAKDKNTDLRGISNMENLSVKLEISFDSRKKGGELGSERLEKTAKMLVSDKEDEGFAIITGSGKRLTANEIRLSDKVKLSPHGNSVFRADAKKALEQYLSDLKGSGMLEQ